MSLHASLRPTITLPYAPFTLSATAVRSSSSCRSYILLFTQFPLTIQISWSARADLHISCSLDRSRYLVTLFACLVGFSILFSPLSLIGQGLVSYIILFLHLRWVSLFLLSRALDLCYTAPYSSLLSS